MPPPTQRQLVSLIDALAFLSLLGMLVTGLVIEFLLPARSGLSEVWGLSRHDWGDLHFYLSLLFLLVISAHLLTHRRYIGQVFQGRAEREHRYRVILGLVALVALIIFLVILFTAPVDGDRRPLPLT